MRIKYKLHKMPLLQQSKCMGDLTKYYGERKFKLLEQVTAIRNNDLIATKLLNTIRKHTGTTGLTIDQLVNGLETAAGVDIFTFKVNDVNPCEMFKDEDLTLEVYMNPIYFTTQAALGAQLPGFRKHRHMDMESKIKDIAQKDQDRWLRWFEKELNNYHPSKLWKRTVLEKD